MTPLTIALLAFSMSADSFVASIAKGSRNQQPPSIATALGRGLLFGAVETIAPLIGWLLGRAATRYIETWDHWIAFALLAGVGLHMIYVAFQNTDTAPRKRSAFALVATAVGTSIDATAVGISLAFLDVNILAIALAIGAATFAMTTTGTLLGGVLGRRFGNIFEVVGGVILVCMGIFILAEHST